jgi:hypothetical protein
MTERKSLLAVLCGETKIRVVALDTNSVTKTATDASFWGRRRVSHVGVWLWSVPTKCIRFINLLHTRERKARVNIEQEMHFAVCVTKTVKNGPDAI